MNIAPGYPVDLYAHPTITESYEIPSSHRNCVVVPEKQIHDWARKLRDAGCDVRVNPLYGAQGFTADVSGSGVKHE